MQLAVLYLRLREKIHSPLAPTEVLQRVQQATTASIAFGWSAPRTQAPLFQGWIKSESFRISAFSQGNNRSRHSSVVIDGEVAAHHAGGSRLRLRYWPLLIQLFALGFWLVFWGTLALVSLLDWLRSPRLSFSWGSVVVVCITYWLAVLSFWWDARQSRHRLISLVDLKQPDVPSIA